MLLLSAALAGCVESNSSILATPSESLSIDTPTIALKDTEFTLPLPRAGDVALFDRSYSYTEADFTYDSRGQDRLTVIGPSTFVDGYGVSHPTIQVNLTWLESTGQTGWNDLQVDAMTNELVGITSEPLAQHLGYATNPDGAGVLRLRADLNSTGVYHNSFNEPNFFNVWASHGGFGQARAMPKEGSWTVYHRGIDHTFEFRTKAAPPPAQAAKLNLTAGPIETYEVRTSAKTSYDFKVDLASLVSPLSPYTLSSTGTDGEGDPTTDGWQERYSFTLVQLVRGDRPLQITHAEFPARPAIASGAPLGDSFPIGGATFLPFTPDQGKAAAKAMDLDVATWFAQNPDAFLSLAVYATYNLNQVWGGAYNALSPQQQDSTRLAIWYTEYTNPKDGRSLGFQTESYIESGSASPPVYERYPWYNDATENFFPFTAKLWLQDRSKIASLQDALAFYRESAPPAYASQDPNLIVFQAYGDSRGGDGYYFLDHRVFPSTAGQVLGLNVAGVGVLTQWNLHMIAMGIDGFRGFNADFFMTWTDTYTVAGVPLPIHARDGSPLPAILAGPDLRGGPLGEG